MALASHPTLNVVKEVNDSYVDRLFDEGEKLINKAASEIARVANNVLTPPDFSGITPTFDSPMDILLADLPTSPTKPILLDVPIDAFPAEPTLTTRLIATDSLIASAIARIMGELESRIVNPTGLKPVIEAAIFGRAVDRESRQQGSGYKTYLDNNSAMGWSSPAGQDKAALIRFETEKKGKLSDVSREIMVAQANLEQQNAQKTLDLYQTLQAQLFEQKRSDEANKIKLYEVGIDNVIKKAQLYISVNDSYISVFGKEVDSYVALVGAEDSRAQLRLKQVAELNSLNAQLTNIAIEKLKLLQQYEISNAGIATEGSKGIAAVLGQLAATLMNAINIGESFSYGKSWSYSESV